MQATPKTHTGQSAPNTSGTAYFTAAQVAAALQKSVLTVRRWTAEGLIPSNKVLNSVLYDWQAVQDALSMLATTTTQTKEIN
jgi:hypothetical protein